MQMGRSKFAVAAVAVAAAFALSGCKKDSANQAPAKAEKKAGATARGDKAAIRKLLTPEKKKPLLTNLKQLQEDQKKKAELLAKIATAPQVKGNKKLLPVVNAAAQKQAEVAVMMERTERFIAKGDP